MPTFRVHYEYQSRSGELITDTRVTSLPSPDDARKATIASLKSDAVPGTLRVKKIKKVRE